MTSPVYLDHHATTPVAPSVFEAMRPYFTEVFGNPGSLGHAYGWQAQEAVGTARAQVARLLNAAPSEILFTSGATESNNLVLKGLVGARRGRSTHIVTTATEHKSVLDPLARLSRDGIRVTVLPVAGDGRLPLDLLERSLGEDTALISVMAANNEIGTLQPLEAIGRLARERGILFHTDFTQAAALLSLDVQKVPVDLLTLSGHKMYGPKGVGALMVGSGRSGAELIAQLDGGGQEQGLRAGTLNVPGIVGLGEACDLARKSRESDAQRLTTLRDHLKETLAAALGDLRINGTWTHRLPNNLNVSFPGVDGEALLHALPEVAVSSGSACNAASGEPSHVLLALGLDPGLARATLRFGLGRPTTADDVDFAAARVIEAIRRLRPVSPGMDTPVAT
ncbi:MAG: cysteine desulfurase [Verrucomicrobiales bacterium]|nr:cysteine desulfurase [Verrucomicrobiales bacterium]